MEKIKVNYEMGKAMELLENSVMPLSTFKLFINGEWNVPKLKVLLHNLTREELIQAYFYGYEVEMSPEDEVVELFNEAVTKSKDARKGRKYQEYWDSYAQGIKDAMFILKIK